MTAYKAGHGGGQSFVSLLMFNMHVVVLRVRDPEGAVNRWVFPGSLSKGIPSCIQLNITSSKRDQASLPLFTGQGTPHMAWERPAPSRAIALTILALRFVRRE
jgi:hypothetical protein